jgi:LPS-assembly lipoprotein
MTRFGRLILFGLLALSACGFQPLYGQRGVSGGSVVEEFAHVRIAPIADRAGQMLYNELRDRLNPQGKPATPRYLLAITLVETRQELAYRGDETATRANMDLVATYVLRHAVTEGDEGEDQVVAHGEARITTSYDILDSQFATLVSIDDARARAVRALSDDLQARLATALSPRSATGRATGAAPVG